MEKLLEEFVEKGRKAQEAVDDILKNQQSISQTITGQFASRRVWIAGRELHPGKSQDLWNHSPDGFSWGYSGSGPAQLALAICLEMTGDKKLSIHLYQRFKREFVSRWQGDFSEPLIAVERWIEENKLHGLG